LAAGIPPVEVYTGPVRDEITSNASVAPAPKKQQPLAARRPNGRRLSPFRRHHP